MNINGQKVQFAYVDESGDPNLDLTKQGASPFYVITAVLVDAGRRDELIAYADQIRAAFCGNGELKSSAVGGDFQRRRDILTALLKADFKFCAFVADKSEIDQNSGLQYKRSFIKYLHGRLYKRLYRAFSALHVIADEHGRSEFMESFRVYLRERYQKELFDHEDFSFVPSENCSLVQVADMIGGTLLRAYAGRDPIEILDCLANAAIIIERWPPKADRGDVTTGLEDDERFDFLVAQQSIMLARDFINTHDESEAPDAEAQVAALRYLLFRYELDASAYIHAQPILDHVNSTREEALSLQSFRMNVIAQLRSSGVIIASSNSGYKIPSTSKDINDFVTLVDGQALPYLERLAIARRHLYVASKGEYDMVQADKYPKLSKCLKSLEAGQFEDL